MNVSCRLDTRNWSAAHQVLHRLASNPSESLHKAVGFVIEDAKDRTPVTPISKIDTELSVTTTPVLVTRGPRTGLPRRDKKMNVDVGDKNTLAMRISLARLHPYSNYNILTDRKYALDRASFSPGMGTAGFWAKLQMVAARMAKARHSSTGFFKISWNALIAKIADFVPANYKNHFKLVSGRGGRTVPPELGTFTPARANEAYAVCKIENNLGMDSEFPTLSEIRNMDAHRILEPVLQQAIDRNFMQQMELIQKRNLLDKSSELRALGVMVN